MSFEEYLTSLQGKTVGVIGVGVSNRPLIEKLLERGIDVTARDKKENLGELGQALTAQGCKLRLGSGYLADLHEDVIFRTPGLRPDVPELAAGTHRVSFVRVHYSKEAPLGDVLTILRSDAILLREADAAQYGVPADRKYIFRTIKADGEMNIQGELVLCSLHQ